MDLRPILQSQHAISPQDVLKLRMEVFSDGLVSLKEAEAVFSLNNRVSEKCDEWAEYFVEVMVDYTVRQALPRGYVSIANAEWLIHQISHDGKVEGHTELELLIKVLEKSHECPQFLVAFALKSVAEAVINGHGKLLGNKNLIAGRIGSGEVELLRRILFAYSGEKGIFVSRAEAEILFDLNDRTVEAENDPSWADLFVRAVANHLMAVSGYQGVSREEALRREKWVEDTDIDVAGMLSKSLSSIGELFSSGYLTAEVRSAHEQLEAAYEKRNNEIMISENASRPVDEMEAEWLAARIGHDGVLHDNEKALLEFLKAQGAALHPALNPLLEKVA